MNTIHQLELLKALIRSYFSDDLQCDETPEGAKKRLELKQTIVELSNRND